jgi:hypothetical protein
VALAHVVGAFHLGGVGRFGSTSFALEWPRKNARSPHLGKSGQVDFPAPGHDHRQRETLLSHFWARVRINLVIFFQDSKHDPYFPFVSQVVGATSPSADFGMSSGGPYIGSSQMVPEPGGHSQSSWKKSFQRRCCIRPCSPSGRVKAMGQHLK